MRWDVFIGSLFNAFAIIFVSSKLLERPKANRLQLLKTFFTILLLGCYIFLSYSLTQNFARTILLFVMIIASNIFLDQTSENPITKHIIASFLTWIMIFFSEILFTIIIFLLSQISLESFYLEYFQNANANFIIILFFIFVSLNPKVLPFLRRCVSNNTNIKQYYALVGTLLSALAVSLIFYLCYFKFNVVITFILCFVIVVIYAIMIYSLFDEKNKIVKMQQEYDLLSESLSEYEKMYQVQRMNNHEYKNELSIIRGLTKKGNQELIDYIDELINLGETENAKWLDKLKQIPEGGLRGILYYKMKMMEEKEIAIDFDINRNVTASMILGVEESVKYNLCKLLGIYLDNAIQAVENLKEKRIRIYLYADQKDDDNFKIMIMNNYEGEIDLSKIYDTGYSTKGKGRGLGLSLAASILSKEKNIKNSTKIIKANFVQELQVFKSKG